MVFQSPHSPSPQTKKVNGIFIKNAEQIEGIKASAQLAAKTLHYLGQQLREGMQTLEIDSLCHEYILDHGAIPAPLNYHGFPKSVCVSVNEVVCHGIPSTRVLRSGDVVNIDVTTILNGYFGDTNFSFFVGDVSEADKLLVQTTQDALYLALEEVYPGNFLSNIGYRIQKHVEKRGYSVVRDYTGHGVGLEFHEPPTVLHYGKPNRGNIRFLPGMTFTIEPMINMGTWQVDLCPKDKWTVTTRDKKKSAQFEHTVLVTESGVEVLSHNPALWVNRPETVLKN